MARGNREFGETQGILGLSYGLTGCEGHLQNKIC